VAVSPEFDQIACGIREYLDGLVARVRRAGVDAHARVVAGAPARMILEVADAENAALVVMATHGRTALTRLTMGSVATEVLSRTRRPVLLLRPEVAGDEELLDTLEPRLTADDPIQLTSGGRA
jgi:hypothetical protein